MVVEKVFKRGPPKTGHKGVSPRGLIRVSPRTSPPTSHKDPLQGLPNKTSSFFSSFTMYMGDGGWGGVCHWGEKAENLSPECIGHQIIGSYTGTSWIGHVWSRVPTHGARCTEGWIFGLTSMSQRQVFSGEVKGHLIPRGLGWLRNCSMLTIIYPFPFCAHSETTYSSHPWNGTGPCFEFWSTE